MAFLLATLISSLIFSSVPAEVTTSQQIAKQMEQIAKKTIIELNLQYKDKHSPYIGEIQKLLLNWIIDHRIINDHKLITKIETSAFANLIGKAYPRATLEALSTVTDFATWLFFYDDMIEKQEKQEVIQNLHARTMEILDGGGVNETDSALAQGFYTIIERINNMCTSHLWKARFKHDLQEYCTATLWEFANRKKGKIPTLEEYRNNRPNTSGTIVMFDFIELLEGIAFPHEVFESNYFQLLRLLGANLVNWENDILSAPKEFLHNDIHNLVFVYQAKDAIGFEDAFQKAAMDLSCDLDAFTKLAQEIPDYGAHTEAVKRYIDGIMDWVAAHHFWAMTSSRYNSL